MNWEQFQRIVEEKELDEKSLLFQDCGWAMDNGTIKKNDGREVPLSVALWQSPHNVDKDFVWIGRNFIRVGGSKGHPGLAGMDPPYCAGRVESYGFFFHSGHYHPQLEHGLSFFAHFITCCAEGTTGVARDQLVDQLGT